MRSVCGFKFDCFGHKGRKERKEFFLVTDQHAAHCNLCHISLRPLRSLRLKMFLIDRFDWNYALVG